jgi:hypothetical protein
VGGSKVSDPAAGMSNHMAVGEPDGTPAQTIVLQTTPGQQIPGHIAVNARCRACDKLLTFAVWPEEDDTVRCTCEEPNQIPVFGEPQQYAGKTLAICGAGPSLKDAYREVRKADHVWGCNRAAHYLNGWGWQCTHAFAIDAGTGMFLSAWKEVPTVSEEFILATSVHPKLVDHVLASGQPVRFFHSARGGVVDEFEYYKAFFPPAPIAGSGLNAVNRSLELAVWLGYKRIYICGADNALKGDEFYADGSPKVDHNDGAVYLKGVVNGRQWTTTPDMLMSATNLTRMKWEYGDKVVLVGNTLPRALARTSDAFLDKCVRWATDDEKRQTAERLKTGNVNEERYLAEVAENKKNA